MMNRDLLIICVVFAIVKLGVCEEETRYERLPPIAPKPNLGFDLMTNLLETGRSGLFNLAAQNINNDNAGGGGSGSGLMQTARNFVNGPMGHLAVSMAKEYISRSAGGSQVLSLNLTSLLVLVLLKALIFAAGMLGAGNWAQYGRGRGIDNNLIMDDAETQLFLGFLAAEGSKQDGCLYRAACMAPEHGSEYLRAARALFQGLEVFDPSIPNNKRYKELLDNISSAIMEGMQNAPCDTIYACDI